MSYLDEDVATNYVCAVDTPSDITATAGGPPIAHLAAPGILDCSDE